MNLQKILTLIICLTTACVITTKPGNEDASESVEQKDIVITLVNFGTKTGRSLGNAAAFKRVIDAILGSKASLIKSYDSTGVGRKNFEGQITITGSDSDANDIAATFNALGDRSSQTPVATVQP